MNSNIIEKNEKGEKTKNGAKEAEINPNQMLGLDAPSPRTIKLQKMIDRIHHKTRLQDLLAVEMKLEKGHQGELFSTRNLMYDIKVRQGIELKSENGISMQQGGRYKDNESRMEASFLKRSHQKLNHIGPRGVANVQSDFPCFDMSE